MAPPTAPHVFTSDQEYQVAIALRNQIISNPERPNFAVTGIINAPTVDIDKIALFVKSQAEQNAGSIASYGLPLSEQDAQKIYAAALPSPHGKGRETVYDASYRQAHELKPPHFALSTDLVHASEVLNSLPITLGLEDQRLTASLHKLNVYGTGGFFKPHRDTPRGENHMGTLTLCLPSEFTGGALSIRQDASEINVDWSTQVLDRETGDSSIGWCFLYADCEHEVLPVESGMRLTLAYDIFYAATPEMALGDTRANGMLEQLAKVFDPRNNLFPDGATLGFGLRHAYAGTQGFVSMKELRHRLKGIDRTLMSVLTECDLKWMSKAVWDVSEWEKTRDYSTSEEDVDWDTQVYVGEGEEPDYPRRNAIRISRRTEQFYDDVLLSNNPRLLEGHDHVEDEFDRLLSCGAKANPGIVWIATSELYESRNSYVAYGNESSPAATYSACALLVDLPEMSKRQTPPALQRFLGKDAEIKPSVL